jgi:porphobilinogen synthase
MSVRYRRVRKSETIRAMIREVKVGIEELVYPMFITFGERVKEEIIAMPGQYRYSIDMAIEAIAEIRKSWNKINPTIWNT